MALFELIDQSGMTVGPGPWRVRPAGAASFAVPQGTEPLWRAELPAGAAGLAALAIAEGELDRHEAALAATPGRIDALAAAGSAASFGAERLPAPERQLLAVLDELRGGAAGPSAASFGVRERAMPEWSEAEGRLRAFIAQVQEAVSSFAVVETRVEGLLVARTSVSWTGDVRSLLGGATLSGSAGLHQRTLRLALRSRATLLKTFGTVMRGAAIVAAMTGSPAGAVLALPAAWRFLEQLLGDLKGVTVNGQQS